ncbi:Por secretion system C-terminal sorting domain-containing protein [Cyclonatronum proteinivorum]|uniref:Por secretion system C-terminal sorting domain-containing protein n=1 Tax=Cyclonatronum proteinivorum TaxID=1457365 RepID=A0A345UHK6_9BACT|nr:choice-of-anchor D domain-containing protein [Cyclonatronum proteinivorum]AXI99957.1 Por secretion system C-terminal sorting domain-containing protein [Cyclonatronum proteinivorum]
MNNFFSDELSSRSFVFKVMMTLFLLISLTDNLLSQNSEVRVFDGPSTSHSPVDKNNSIGDRIEYWNNLYSNEKSDYLNIIKERTLYIKHFTKNQYVLSIGAAIIDFVELTLMEGVETMVVEDLLTLQTRFYDAILDEKLIKSEVNSEGFLQYTVLVRPNATQWWTGTVTRSTIGNFSYNVAHGNSIGGISAGRNSVNYRSRSWVFFNISSIPNNATVVNAELDFFLTDAGNSSHRINIGQMDINTFNSLNGPEAIYNYIGSVPTFINNWNGMTPTAPAVRQVSYTTSGRNYLQNSITSGNIHGISIRPASDTIMQRGQFRGWDCCGNSAEPWLRITYTLPNPTPPPPTLVSPTNGASNVPVNTTLSWNSSSGATSYQLQVATSSSFTSSSLVVNQSNITSTSRNVNLNQGTTYYWRVRATNNSGSSDWSATRTFTTICNTPSLPVLVSPSNGATITVTNPTLSWNSSSGATHYELQVATNSSFSASSIVFNQGVSGTSRTINLEPDITYFWRVRAVNSCGVSNWSARSFTIQLPPSTINVTVRNIDNTPKQGAIVVRFNSNWQPVQERITNASGVASFTGLPANQIFHFQVYNPTDHVTENEFWGQVANINSGVSQTISVPFTRRAPYSGGISYSSQNLQSGEEVTITVGVANPENISKNTRVRIQIARGTRTNVIHTEMKTLTLSPSSNNILNYTYTPAEPGDYFVRAHFTQANYENMGWVTTDSWSWPDEVSFTVQPPPTSNIGVTIRNFDNAPKPFAKVVMYNAEWQELEEKEADSQGIALFTQVPANQIFHFEGYNPTPHHSGNEFWGAVTNVNSGQSQNIPVDLVRKAPFSRTYSLSTTNLNVGESISIGIVVVNGESFPVNTRVRLQIAKDSPSNIVHTQSSSFSAPPLQENALNFNFTPQGAGEYYIRAWLTEAYYDGWKLTDTWAWPEDPAFTVNALEGNLEIVVKDANNNNTEGVDLVIYENTTSGLVNLNQDRTTNQNGVAFWESLDATKIYTFDVFKSTPVIAGLKEYWGSLNQISISPNTSNHRQFNRNASFSEGVLITNENGHIANSFFGGEVVNVDVRVRNRSDFTQDTRVVFQVATDTLATTPTQITSNFKSIEANSYEYIRFSFFAPNTGGTYYVRPYKTEVSNISNEITLTDTWYWVEGFDVTSTSELYISSVVPQTTVTLSPGSSQLYTITVRDDNQNAVSGVTVQVDDQIAGLNTSAGPTDSNGRTTYIVEIPFDFVAGQYSLEFFLYNSENTIIRNINVDSDVQIDAVIVTVDGIDIGAMIAESGTYERESNYLEVEIEELINSNRVEIIPYSWNGDIRDTVQHVDSLKTLLLAAYEIASINNAKLIVTGHSWGTLLSYVAMAQLRENIFVDLYITLSSPLGTYFAHPLLTDLEFVIHGTTYSWLNELNFSNCYNCVPNINRFINYWAYRDAISGPLGEGWDLRAEDVVVDSYLNPVGIYLSRLSLNIINNIRWHKYTSLRPTNFGNNLRNAVYFEIMSLIDNTPPPPQPVVLNEIVIPDNITIGDNFNIQIDAKNIGGLATYGSISVSFPGLSNLDGIQISSNTTNPSYVSTYNEGDLIWRYDGEQIPADYLLIEYGDPAWDMNHEQTLALEITPQVAGEYVIDVRVNMGNQSTGAYYNNPIESEYYDQQGWSVIRYIVVVLPDDDEIPLITINPVILDYEQVEIGNFSEQVLTITNTSTNNSTLSGTLEIEGGYFTITSGDYSFNLTSGQYSQVTVQYAPIGSEAVHTGMLSISHNAPNRESPFDVILVGDAVEALEVVDMILSIGSIDFGNIIVNECENKSLLITNSTNSTSQLNGSLILNESDQYSILTGGQPFNISPGQDRLVEIEFCAPSELGNMNAMLRIVHNAGNIDSPIDIPLTANVVSDLSMVDFALNVNVFDTASNSQNLIIGTAYDATNGLDPQYDQPAPPSPPDGAFDARIRTSNGSFFSFFQPTTQEQTTWNIRFEPASNAGPISLSWNPDELPSEGSFSLTDIIDGNFVSINMRSVNEFTIPYDFINELRLTHSVIHSHSRSYTSGWALVGMPVVMQHNSYSDIFNHAMPGSFFGYEGSYIGQSVFLPGNGYWINLTDDEDVIFSGSIIDHIELDLNENWNLISGTSESTPVSGIQDPDNIIVPGTIYYYDGAYVEATVIEPGLGYWVLANDSGVVVLGVSGQNLAGMGRPAGSINEIPKGFSKIEISDGQRTLIPLYFGAELSDGESLMGYALPPIPPAGSPDARFEGNKRLSESELVHVKLQQGSIPMVLNLIAHDHNVVFTVRQISGSVQLDESLIESHRTLQILPNTEILEIRLNHEDSTVELPKVLTLMQNYPNPFNPSTQIEFGLPQGSDVRLEIFNISGQRVAQLVNGYREAGWHSISFDASNLSSGLYLYRIQAGNFSETKKMMLVK